MYIHIDIDESGAEQSLTCSSIMEASCLTASSHTSQGPPEYGRICDYSEQVTVIAYYSL